MNESSIGLSMNFAISTENFCWFGFFISKVTALTVFLVGGSLVFGGSSISATIRSKNPNPKIELEIAVTKSQCIHVIKRLNLYFEQIEQINDEPFIHSFIRLWNLKCCYRIEIESLMIIGFFCNNSHFHD